MLLLPHKTAVTVKVMQETQHLPSQNCAVVGCSCFLCGPKYLYSSDWCHAAVLRLMTPSSFPSPASSKKQNTTWHSMWPVCLLETPVIPTQIWLVQLGEGLELGWQGGATAVSKFSSHPAPVARAGVPAPPSSLSSLINISGP